MPFTPLHLGPATVVKAVVKEKFSLTVFGLAQLLMDIQPLAAMLGADIELHGLSHTYVGATLIGLISGLAGRPFRRKLWHYLGFQIQFPGQRIIRLNPNISWPIIMISAFFGTYSHVFLDSFMHADLTPYYPLAIENTWVHIFSIEQLYAFCFWSGLIGSGVYIFRMLYDKTNSKA